MTPEQKTLDKYPAPWTAQDGDGTGMIEILAANGELVLMTRNTLDGQGRAALIVAALNAYAPQITEAQ